MKNIMSIRKMDLAPSEFKWFLESPKLETSFDLNTKELLIAGWVANDITDHVTIIIENVEYELNVNRPDVIEAFYPSDTNKVLMCGFKHVVKLNSRNFKIGIKSKNKIEWVCSIEIVGKIKVLKGKDDWLFLDNDTNHSVSQFKGESIIPPKGMQEYKSFFENVKYLSHQYDFKWSFSVAPAKEFMVEEYYPYKKGALTVIEQITSFSEQYKQIDLFFDKLKSSSGLSYWKGDTHWTHYGGFVAVVSILKGLGIDVPEDYFKVNYSISSASGDLNTKMPGGMKHLLRVNATNVHVRPHYNNGIINHGNVKIFVNEKAFIDKSCLMFAGSSAGWMFPFLAKIFSRLVVVHTAGSIDESVIKNENPDFVVININSRFLLRPPTTDVSLDKVVEAKPSSKVIGNSSDIKDKDKFYRDMIKF